MARHDPRLCITPSTGTVVIMMMWREGIVAALRERWHGAVVLDVELHRATVVPALAYPALVGDPMLGDRVLVNLNAYAHGLGTGGYAMVVALPDRLPPDVPVDRPLVKGRYTPQQSLLPEIGPPRAETLDGMPVVTADLHSALPAIVAGIHAVRPLAQIAYVMTDGGALPAWFSRTLSALRPRLAGVVTSGQAFGGDVEAVNVHSGLLAAGSLGADIAVVTQGPGNLGTGTTWGFSGIAAGEAVNAVAVLGGRPVGALRISDADPRPRHRGISHHSLTAYGRVALAPADLVLPLGLPPHLLAAVRSDLAALPPRHRVIEIPAGGLMAALEDVPVPLSTMGRDLASDPWYFIASAAAGAHAATLLDHR